MAQVGKRINLPPINRFILDAVAVHFGGPPPAPPAGLDWDQFCEGVIYHRVPLLMSAALEHEAVFPETVRQRLRAAQKRAALRTLTLNVAAVQAIEACRASGVDALLLKGPAHSAHFFGRYDRRWARDIDLLVRPEDRAFALKALAEVGYLAEPDDDDPAATVTLHRRQDEVPIELHVCLDGDDRQLPLSLLQPFADARNIMIGGHSVQTMNPEKSLVYAAFHGAKHLWRQYFWLCDIAAARCFGQVDHRMAWDVARRIGVERHLLVADLLVEDCFGLPPPSDAFYVGSTLDKCRRLAQELRSAMADDDFDRHGMRFRRMGRMRYLWWDVRMQRRWAARWATLIAPWRPSSRDRRFLSLPSGLGFLYPAIRLFRVLADGAKRFASPRR